MTLAAVEWPLAGSAQQKAMPVVGFLGSRSPGEAANFVIAFHQGLAETGSVEGENLAIEYRWARTGSFVAQEGFTFGHKDLQLL
jgi:putative ABC transport system substrate-binding protein